MSRLSEIFDAVDPELCRNTAYCPQTMSFTPCAGHPGARYVREDAALEALSEDVRDAHRAGALAVLSGEIEVVGEGVASETVWADALDAKSALHALLDGKLVYASRELAIFMTGRVPVQVQLIARIKT